MGTDTRRLILALALSMGVLFVFNFLQPKPQPRPAPAAPAKTAQPAAQPAPSGPSAQPNAAPTAQPAPPPADEPEQTVDLDGGNFVATFSSHGGVLKHFWLKDEKFRQPTGDMDLVRVQADQGQPFPLALVASPELGGSADAAADRTARAPMRLSKGADGKSVVFEGRVANVDVKKTFRVTGRPYELAMDLEVTGGSGGTVALLWPAYQPPNTSGGGFLSAPPLEIVKPLCRAGDSTDRYDLSKEPATEKLAGTALWAGADQHYFVGAVLPDEPVGTCVFSRGPKAGEGQTALVVPVDQARKLSAKVFVGPKDLDYLRAYGRSFDTAVEYYALAKPFALFARGLLYVMRWLDGLVRNWGVAIILLTLLVKTVLFPLTYKQLQSANEMRKLQPEVAKLQAKFKDDKQKMNMAVMQLYQQHKVNPLGGCLPMLLQMPIWMALYGALQTSVELYRAPFLWISDLTVHDPYYILPVLMGVSSFVMQKLSPQPADNQQAKMMLYMMPILFTALMFKLAAGLTLYIFVNNLLSIVQQQVMMRRQQPAVAVAK